MKKIFKNSIVLFLVLIFVTPGIASAALTDNILSYWKLDDTTDATGNGNTLTNNNSVTFTSGLIGNGANFGSANTNKSLSTATNVGLTNTSWSFSFWTKLLTDTPDNGAVYGLTTWGDATSKYHLRISTNRVSTINYVDFQILGATTLTIEKANFEFGTTNWHYVTLTSNGTTVNAYLDNVNVGSGSLPAAAASDTSQFKMGVDDAGRFSSAMEDEYGVWSRALSTSEISQLYNNGAGFQYPFTISNYFGDFIMFGDW